MINKAGAALSEDEYVRAKRILGLQDDYDKEDYGEYKGARDANYTVFTGANALGGAALGGITGGPVGAALGGGVGAVKGLFEAAVLNYLKDRRLRNYVKDKEESDSDGDEEDDRSDSDNRKEKTGEAVMATPYQAGFIKQCAARGIDPRAVVAYTQEYNRGRAAAAAYVEKRASAVREALNKMTPYQQGFAIRCSQRGIPATKVAEFCAKAARIKK